MLNIEYIVVSQDGQKSETRNIDIDSRIKQSSPHTAVYVAISKLMDHTWRKENTELPEITDLSHIMVLGYRRDESEEYIPYRAALHGPERQRLLQQRATEEKAARIAKERAEQARLATQVGAPMARPGNTEGVAINTGARNVPTDQISGVTLSNKSR